MVVENQEIELSGKSSQKETKNDASVNHSKSDRLFGRIIILILLGLAGGGYFLFHQLKTEQQGLDQALDKGDHRVIELTKQITSIQTQMATLQSTVATVEQNFATQDSQFERSISDSSSRHNEKLDQTKRVIDEEIQRIQRQLGKTRGDWLMADAEFLLSVANERLHLVGDVKTAVLALEAADQRLRESGDPAAFKVREALVNDINTLKRVEMPDIIGLSSRLRTLERGVSEIPLRLPHLGKVEEEKKKLAKQFAESQQTESSSGEWDAILDSALEDFKGLVKVKRKDQPIDSVLREEQADLLREDLRLKLEIARIALIQRNQSLFRNNLIASLEWLSEHFDSDADKTRMVKNEIQELSDTTIQIEFPDISKSLVLLRNITKLRIETDKAMKPQADSEES